MVYWASVAAVAVDSIAVVAPEVVDIGAAADSIVVVAPEVVDIGAAADSIVEVVALYIMHNKRQS